MEKKISEIKKEFEMAGTEKHSELFAAYADDSRAGAVSYTHLRYRHDAV